jgi:hypothetical protein
MWMSSSAELNGRKIGMALIDLQSGEHKRAHSSDERLTASVAVGCALRRSRLCPQPLKRFADYH